MQNNRGASLSGSDRIYLSIFSYLLVVSFSSEKQMLTSLIQIEQVPKQAGMEGTKEMTDDYNVGILFPLRSEESKWCYESSWMTSLFLK